MDFILSAASAMTYAEIFAVLTGLIYVFFAARGSIWCWVFGIVSSALWAYAAIVHFQLYADFLLQVIYVIAGIYGWISWNNHLQAAHKVAVSTMKVMEHLYLIIGGSILSIIAALLLSEYTSAAMPWLDSFTTVFSLLTTWLIITRKVENWLYWIVIDLAYIYLYTVREGYLFAALFVIYTLIAIVGYFQWRKLLAAQTVNHTTE